MSPRHKTSPAKSRLQLHYVKSFLINNLHFQIEDSDDEETTTAAVAANTSEPTTEQGAENLSNADLDSTINPEITSTPIKQDKNSSFHSTTKKCSKRKSKSEKDDIELNLLSSVSEAIKKYDSPEDDAAIFEKSIANKLRKITDTEQRLLLEHKIEQLCFEAAWKQINTGSTTGSTPSYDTSTYAQAGPSSAYIYSQYPVQPDMHVTAPLHGNAPGYMAAYSQSDQTQNSYAPMQTLSTLQIVCIQLFFFVDVTAKIC